MAIVKRSALAWNSSLWANWFGSLGCSLITIDGTDIVIDGMFTIRLYQNHADYPRVGIWKDDVQLQGPTVAGSSTITVACSDTLFYVWSNDQNGSSGVGIYLVYEKTPDFTIYACPNTHITGFSSIQNYTFVDRYTGDEYAHSGVLKYSREINSIDYTEDSLFSTSVQRIIQDPNFISCSTVTQDSVVTFNGKNHYSVGPNILVSIDEDED